jgi:hypothetical protein
MKAQRKVGIGLLLAFTISILTSCGTSKPNSQGLAPTEKQLIARACTNLPNLLNWLNWKDINQPWAISLQAFSELARLNPGYVQISADAQKIADTIGPFFTNSKDDNGDYVSKEVYAINGLCGGLGSLTPKN